MRCPTSSPDCSLFVPVCEPCRLDAIGAMAGRRTRHSNGRPVRSRCKAMSWRGTYSAMVSPTTSDTEPMSAIKRRTSAVVRPPGSPPGPKNCSLLSTTSTSREIATRVHRVEACQPSSGSLDWRSASGENVVIPHLTALGKSSSVYECRPAEAVLPSRLHTPAPSPYRVWSAMLVASV